MDTTDRAIDREISIILVAAQMGRWIHEPAWRVLASLFLGIFVSPASQRAHLPVSCSAESKVCVARHLEHLLMKYEVNSHHRKIALLFRARLFLPPPGRLHILYHKYLLELPDEKNPWMFPRRLGLYSMSFLSFGSTRGQASTPNGKNFECAAHRLFSIVW